MTDQVPFYLFQPSHPFARNSGFTGGIYFRMRRYIRQTQQLNCLFIFHVALNCDYLFRTPVSPDLHSGPADEMCFPCFRFFSPSAAAELPASLPIRVSPLPERRLRRVTEVAQDRILLRVRPIDLALLARTGLGRQAGQGARSAGRRLAQDQKLLRQRLLN